MKMKVNMGQMASFLVGFAIGGVVSALVTRKVVDETYKKVADDEIFKIWQKAKDDRKKDQDKIQELNEKITAQSVTIKTLADQVRRSGEVPAATEEAETDDDAEADIRREPEKSEIGHRDRQYTEYQRVARRYRGSEAEFPEADPVKEEEIVEKSGPEVISEDDFSCTCMEYGKEDLRFFIFDGKVLTEDGEFLDNYANFIGENWRLHGHRAGDEVYVRNDELETDYRVIFTAGKGEDNIDFSGDLDD